MPEINGLDFPAHVHQEYPKVLYRAGVSHVDGNPAESMTVADQAEEEAAAELGFSPLTAEEVQADPEAGEPEPVEAVAEAEEAPDADGDGHDDETGEFTSPNPGRRGRHR